MKTGTEKIVSILEPLVRQKGLFLVDVELSGVHRGRTLKVFVDSIPGVTIEQCTELSREIGLLLDVESVFDGPYRLEVSSPGVSRPLTEEWQYQKNVGRKLKVRFTDGEGITELTGVLKAIEGGSIRLLKKSGKREELVQIPMAAVKMAKVQVQW